MASENESRCAREGCDCAVAADQTYCSAYCERAETQRESESGTCECGHPRCGADEV